ncbi:MAG: MFS transporter [Synergistaceae bacterium]|jgi:predicted MFS family arabinose efflux permease|nr:MFS transporter [Synergistaceae bacterium]
MGSFNKSFSRSFIVQISFALAFLASVIFLILSGDNFTLSVRPDIVKLDSPALAVKGSSSSMYVVDSSRKRLLRIDDSDRVDFIVHSGSNRFSEIHDLAVDSSGDVFILDMVREGRRIKSEIVRRYSSWNRSGAEIFRVDHEIPTFKRTIAGLAQNGEGGCSFITLEDDRFVLHSQSPGNSEKWVSTSYDFTMASEMFNRFDVGGNGLVLFTTRRGEICRADGGEIERIFSSRSKADGGDGSIAWDVAVGDDGALYFADLGRRRISALGVDGETETIQSDPDTIYYHVSAKNGIVAVSKSGVMAIDKDGVSVREEFETADIVVVMRICAWIAALVFLAGCAWGLILLTRFLIRKNSFVVKFSSAVIVGTLLVAGVFCLIVTRDITNRMTREMLNRLTNVAELLALQIPGRAFDELDSVDDYMSATYVAVRESIENVVIRREEYAGMYCVLYKILDGSIAEVFDSDNDHGIVNYPYDWSLEGSDEMEILGTGVPKTYTYPSWVDGGVIFALCPVYGDAEEPIGLIEIGSALAAFRRENRNLVLNLFLNVISMSIAMIIVVVELLVFVDARGKMAGLAARGSSYIPADMMRSAVFLVYFITNMATSFLPIYARDVILTEGRSFPFPIEFLIAAPISADVLMGAVASLLGDWIVRKLGLRRTAIIGGVVVTAGICLEVAFYDIFTLTAGFAVCGFGCGLILFLANLKIAREENEAERDRGFSGITVAMTSGVNGGVVFGAFLINWLSQRSVLGMAAVVSLALLAFSVRYMTKLDLAIRHGKRKQNGTLQFLRSPRVLLYLLTLLGPAIASGYFIIYLFPIVGFDLGISENNIGYAFLLNSLMVIIFSSSLTNVFSRKFGKPVSLALWMLVYAASFAAFAFFQNISALLLVLVLMGFADSFGQSLSTSYYTELPEVAKYGYGKAIGISNVVDNVFQTIGPFVFSYVLHIGLSAGLTQIAAGLVALSLVFLLSSLWLKSES